VSQDEGKGMSRRHAVERKSCIGMADTAACNLDNYFVRARIKDREFARPQRSVGSIQLESMRPLNAGHLQRLLVPEVQSVLERSFK
jgi:hypothetical protein